jgi:hypothetical protein
MKFRAEEYYQASLDRIRQAAGLLREENSFALTIYCGGLAVECLLRAFRWTDDATFEGRHDLFELLKASRLLQIDDEHMRRRGEPESAIRDAGLHLRAAMNKVSILWHNNLRFASEASLKAFLNRMGRLRGIKGDPLKKNASELVEAAHTVINRGVALWTSKIKS